MITTERVQPLLEPAYVERLAPRTLDELREMQAECREVEMALSYFRRLAQARIEILEAEAARRERGGSVEDLVADLPRILGAESGRSTVATRVAPRPPMPPTIEIHWPDGREQLVVDTTLANLPRSRTTSSTTRSPSCATSSASSPTCARQLHRVIDGIDA